MLSFAAELQHAGQKRTVEERDIADDDFIIHSSQSYTRLASQALLESDASQVYQLHSRPAFLYTSISRLSGLATMQITACTSTGYATAVSAL